MSPPTRESRRANVGALSMHRRHTQVPMAAQSAYARLTHDTELTDEHIDRNPSICAALDAQRHVPDDVRKCHEERLKCSPGRSCSEYGGVHCNSRARILMTPRRRSFGQSAARSNSSIALTDPDKIAIDRLHLLSHTPTWRQRLPTVIHATTLACGLGCPTRLQLPRRRPVRLCRALRPSCRSPCHF